MCWGYSHVSPRAAGARQARGSDPAAPADPPQWRWSGLLGLPDEWWSVVAVRVRAAASRSLLTVDVVGVPGSPARLAQAGPPGGVEGAPACPSTVLLSL